MITIACLWVRGSVPYSVDYVTRLLSMVSRNIDQKFRFVCLTDRPQELPQIETIDVSGSRLNGLKAWWLKLELFNPAHQLGGTVLYIDLDSLIVGPLGRLLEFFGQEVESLCLVPPGGDFKPIGYRTVRRFNSSVMAFYPWHCRSLFESFNPAYAKRGASRVVPLWGDQDWIGEVMPEAATFPAEWFPRLSEIVANQARPPSEQADFGEAVVVLAKKPKPHVAAATMSFVAEAWH